MTVTVAHGELDTEPVPDALAQGERVALLQRDVDRELEGEELTEDDADGRVVALEDLDSVVVAETVG